MRYCFEDYSLDVEARELRRGDARIALEPLVFDVLEFLLRNHRRIVTKDDLILGVWDRRIVSDSTLSSRVAAVRQAIGDTGKQQRFIRTIPRRGFRFVAPIQEEWEETRSRLTSVAIRDEPTTLSKPTIAVLPFECLSQGPELRRFAQGLLEDLTTELTQLRWLDIQEGESSADNLRTHYVLRGSVRSAGRRMRVSARLADSSTGRLIWAQRFDAWRQNTFAFQDQVSAHVAGAIGSKLEQVEIRRAKQLSPERSDAASCYMRGLGGIYQWNKGGISDALLHFQKAVQSEPEFASAYAMAAYCYIQRKSYGWICDRTREIAECARLARRAAELAEDDPLALSRSAHAIASVCKDVDTAGVLIDRALTMNPSLAAAWYVDGWINLFMGNQRQAVDHLTRAITLAPQDRFLFKMKAALAYALFFAGRYDEASVLASQALRSRPGYLTAIRAAAASHALAGRSEQARALIAEMRKGDPCLSVANLPDLLPFLRTRDLEKWSDALRRAGLPD
jgi:TolB-like protein/Flp pilus assembly protein TadD